MRNDTSRWGLVPRPSQRDAAGDNDPSSSSSSCSLQSYSSGPYEQAALVGPWGPQLGPETTTHDNPVPFRWRGALDETDRTQVSNEPVNT